MYKKRLMTMLTVAVLLAGGCAPKNWNAEEDGAFDPLEGFNREIYKFNKGIDYILLKPAAQIYDGLPSPITTGVGNVLNNLTEPANAVNNALQKEGDATFNSTARFAFNTVFGVGGLVDVASMWGIERREADFGQTLRGYGLDNTMYFVLPLVGPTTFSDTIGRGVDSRLYPPTYLENDKVFYGITAMRVIHTRADLLEATNLMEEIAIDEYIFAREAYEEQRRANAPSSLWGK